MGNFLDNLRKKPIKTKKKVMWIGVSSCAFIIFLFWLFFAPHQPDNKNSNLDLGQLKKDAQEKFDKTRIESLTGEAKKLSKGLSNNKEEEVVKESVEPRLPLEIQ